MVTEILVIWTILGGGALALAGKDLLEAVDSELAGWTLMVAFGPLAWFIVAIAALGYGLDKLADRWRAWRA